MEDLRHGEVSFSSERHREESSYKGIFHALVTYDYKEVESILKKDYTQANAFYKPLSYRPLYLAVEASDLRMVDLLLDHGANPNLGNTHSRSKGGNSNPRQEITALVHAIENNNLAAIERLAPITTTRADIPKIIELVTRDAKINAAKILFRVGKLYLDMRMFFEKWADACFYFAKDTEKGWKNQHWETSFSPHWETSFSPNWIPCDHYSYASARMLVYLVTERKLRIRPDWIQTKTLLNFDDGEKIQVDLVTLCTKRPIQVLSGTVFFLRQLDFLYKLSRLRFQCRLRSTLSKSNKKPLFQIFFKTIIPLAFPFRDKATQVESLYSDSGLESRKALETEISNAYVLRAQLVIPLESIMKVAPPKEKKRKRKDDE